MTKIKSDTKVAPYHPTLDTSKIRFSDYYRTLTAEMARCGMISERDMPRFQNGLYEALQEAVRMYTGGESTSVLTETANDLLASVIYNIDAYLIGLKSVDRAADEVSARSPLDLYMEGIRYLQKLTADAMGLLIKVRRTRISTPNIIYNTNIDQILKKAITGYDIRFGRNESSFGDIDYPLAAPNNTLKGILYLNCYLTYLWYENSFCREYDPEECHALYWHWCTQNDAPLADARVNLYTIVMLNALFCEYMKKEPGTLSLSATECDVICSLLNEFSREEQQDILTRTADRMIGGNSRYHCRVLKKHMKEILNAVRHNTLAHYLTIF